PKLFSSQSRRKIRPADPPPTRRTAVRHKLDSATDRCWRYAKMTAPSPEGPGPDGLSSSDELRSALAQLARVPQLLIACDYDGTLAPIVTDPSQAKPIPESVSALRTLANLPQTKVAVISGRALRDLAALSRLPSEIHLVGSHGSEFDVGFTRALSSEEQRRRDKLVAELTAIAERYDGARVEPKP